MSSNFYPSIGISLGEESNLEFDLKNAKPNQENPSGYYVYGHFDLSGNLFYVGKGKNRRAWEKDRHFIWERYVSKNLNGFYDVRIIIDSLTEEDAEYIENHLMIKHGNELVNWINFGRVTYFDQYQIFHEERNKNRKLIEKTKSIEKTDIETAINNYKEAIENIAKYAFIELEGGLIGRILNEINQDVGYKGELEALDRITICLKKANRLNEANKIADAYFEKYKADLHLKAAEKIIGRI